MLIQVPLPRKKDAVSSGLQQRGTAEESGVDTSIAHLMNVFEFTCNFFVILHLNFFSNAHSIKEMCNTIILMIKNKQGSHRFM